MGPFIEANAFLIELTGLVMVLAAAIWFPARAIRNRFGSGPRRKQWRPIGLLLLGLAIGAFPPITMQLVPVDLGPYERVVDGQRHLTLTGWDRKDYAVLGSKGDAVVLQMANADVTDATLANLKGMDSLKELDLSHSGVTDAGLDVLKGLPALATLRLAQTKITDSGFKSALAAKESLTQLDLRGTGVGRETVQAWKAARPGRRAMQ